MAAKALTPYTIPLDSIVDYVDSMPTAPKPPKMAAGEPTEYNKRGLECCGHLSLDHHEMFGPPIHDPVLWLLPTLRMGLCIAICVSARYHI